MGKGDVKPIIEEIIRSVDQKLVFAGLSYEEINELNELGVEPKDLDSEIEKLTNEINDLLKEANRLLPKDLLEKKWFYEW